MCLPTQGAAHGFSAGRLSRDSGLSPTIRSPWRGHYQSIGKLAETYLDASSNPASFQHETVSHRTDSTCLMRQSESRCPIAV